MARIPESSHRSARPVLLGFCRSLDPEVGTGELIVATRVTGVQAEHELGAPRMIAGALRRRGLVVHEGIVRCDGAAEGLTTLPDPGATGLASPRVRRALEGSARPRAVVLAVVGTARPGSALQRGRISLRALRTLWRARRIMGSWDPGVAPKTIVLAAPRAACAGVERAIETVEMALARYGAPIYVRKQIVHNTHVVGDLERRGVVFVDEVDDVPPGATIVFSAHGVAPGVRDAAARRDLRIIDATCPLVSKVHAEARRFAASGHTIVLVGHEGHEEVDGTRGEAPERMRVVAEVADVDAVEADDPQRVAVLTQTTLSVDDTLEAVAALRARFPALAEPRTSDICYATQNRQDAVKALARECDLILVIGSDNSSNSRRLVEVAAAHGASAHLIDDESAVDPNWLLRARRIGLTAGASASEALVQHVLGAICAFAPTVVEERVVARELVHFNPPPIW